MKGAELPRVLVNSVPKSGTHLLLQIILGIPGMKITPTWIMNNYQFDSLTPGRVGPGHLNFSKERAELLKQNDIKMIFISRDLRDIAVSLVHFVMLNKWGNHPWNPYLQQKLTTHDERLLAIIQGVTLSKEEEILYGITHIPNIFEFTRYRYMWLQEKDICHVTFEDLVKDQLSQDKSIQKIIDYLWGDLSHLNLDKEKLLHIIKEHINPESSGTFRSGKIGSWREEFKSTHKDVFKEIAGDFLVQLGYEDDHKW
jgi:hypothetical protein